MIVDRNPGLEKQARALAERTLIAMERAQSLRPQLSSNEAFREAFLFNLERMGWAVIELAQLWVLEYRLGVPQKDTAALDVLAYAEWITPELARKLRYVSETRNLSLRDPGKVDWSYFESSGLDVDFTVVKEWLNVAAAFPHPVSG